ncbi:MAG: MlaD family protein [Longimicrobiales bacterium]
MSIRANPTAIGLFMIGAIILIFIGVGTLASTTWFRTEATFISFFDESVHGLESGAPVKFQGVPVGSVTELLIQIDERDKTFQVPVRFEIEIERLTTQAGGFIQLDDPEVLRQQIANGLRAQLQMESLVTGLLFIDLSYRSDAEPPELESRHLISKKKTALLRLAGRFSKLVAVETKVTPDQQSNAFHV